MSRAIASATRQLDLMARDRLGRSVIAQHRRQMRHINRQGALADPWGELCFRCPLPNCIRADGEYAPVPAGKDGGKYPGCLIYDAAKAGLTPEEAIGRIKNDLPPR